MPQRTLLLMRHAKSDWSNHGLPDHDRPLNQRGIRASKLIGKHLEQFWPKINVVLASTAVRVQQTLELMQEEWNELAPTIIHSECLYLAAPSTILRQISLLDSHVVAALVIAHNPGLESLAQKLSRQPIEFPTACLAEFHAKSRSWEEAADHDQWKLGKVIRPRDLE